MYSARVVRQPTGKHLVEVTSSRLVRWVRLQECAKHITAAQVVDEINSGRFNQKLLQSTLSTRYIDDNGPTEKKSSVNVLEWLRLNPGMHSLTEIKRNIGGPPSTLSMTLNKLVRKNDVCRAATSRYYEYGAWGTIKESSNFHNHIMRVLEAHSKGLPQRTLYALMGVHIPHGAKKALNELIKQGKVIVVNARWQKSNNRDLYLPCGKS